ncbi:hypothetical protein [Luteolibacter sp. LG18]|uniref:hypothetical protein n=1 Tax=Luteolibacter sp. LG18 TaxID=2819286 RepID=UPI0030C6B87A
MIRCLPLSVCSWGFSLEGEGQSATTRLGGWESGTIELAGRTIEIERQGAFSGTWVATDESGRVIATARKTSAFTRTVEGESPAGPFTLKADSAFRRAMRFETPRGSAVIAPDHAFTRRASIEDHGLDFTTSCFAFWMTALLWKRAADSAAAGT